jgi:two-component system response regulator
MTLESATPMEILLVEDNPGDAEITKRVVQDSKLAANIALAEDGEVAMAYLRKDGEHSDAPRPDLIILDLKMPNKDGYEVLADMRQDNDLKGISVMILTSAQSDRDRLFDLGLPPGNFSAKPLEPAVLARVVERLKSAPPQAQETPAQPAPEPAQPAARAKKWWWPFGNR